MAYSFYASFGLPVVIARPFNTYGPRQSARAVIPTIISQLLSGKKELRLGNLKPKRDLTFVSDTVEGFLKAGVAKSIEGEVIQLGTATTHSIEEIARTAMDSLGIKARIVKEKERLRPDASEVMVLLSDPSKAKKVLGWKHVISLGEGIEATAAWLEKNIGLYKTDIYQI